MKSKQEQFQRDLYELGVRQNTLSSDEKVHLDELGFLPLHGILSEHQASLMREAMEELFALEKTGQKDAASECSNMQNKSDVFDICVTHPRVLASISHVLKEEFKSLGVHSRPNPPGSGAQDLHTDWGLPRAPGEYLSCNSMWPLVDFTKENGVTRIVPRTHCSGKLPKDELTDLKAVHPEEVLMAVPLGTVVIFNSHAWHGATLNRSQSDRPNVTSFWCRRQQPDGHSRPNGLSEDATNRMSEAARRLFDP